MAHVVEGVNKFYSSHGKKELLENYVSALPFIVPKSVPELESQLLETEAKNLSKIEALQQEHNKEFEEMKEALEMYSKQYSKLESKLNALTGSEKKQEE